MKQQLVSKALFPLVSAHLSKWNSCQACPLHTSSTQKVHFRGNIPADVVFIGEAPGQGEDHTGLPFVGEAGSVLDAIIGESVGTFNTSSFLALSQDKQIVACFGRKNQTYKLSYCILNICACRPPNNREPDKEERRACSPRVVELLKLCSPKLAVLLGKTAQVAFGSINSQLPEMIRSVAVAHPASLFYKEDPELERKKISTEILSAIRKVFSPS